MASHQGQPVGVDPNVNFASEGVHRHQVFGELIELGESLVHSNALGTLGADVVAANVTEGVTWLEKSAAQENPYAQHLLATRVVEDKLQPSLERAFNLALLPGFGS